jgi:hypothetical protein
MYVFGIPAIYLQKNISVAVLFFQNDKFLFILVFLQKANYVRISKQ